MKLSKKIKEQINSAFKYSVIKERTTKGYLKMLNTKANGSDTFLITIPVDKIEIEHMDSKKDIVNLVYDDYTIKGVAYWEETKNGHVFLGYE